MRPGTCSVVIAAFAAVCLPTATALPACTDASMSPQYSAIQSQMSACQAVSGVSMVLPLGVKKKQILCDSCPDLKALTIQKGLPKCMVTLAVGTIRLQQEFNRLFKPCLTDADDGSSDGDSGGATTATPTTTAPPVTVTSAPAVVTTTKASTPTATVATKTSSPASSTSTATSTSNKSTTATTAPTTSSDPSTTTADNDASTTTATSSASSSNSSGTQAAEAIDTNASSSSVDDESADDNEEAGTIATSGGSGSTATTSTKKSTKTTKKSSSSSTTASSSQNDGDAQLSADQSSGSSTGMTIGIIAGVLAVVAVSAALIFVYTRRHKKQSADATKFDDSILNVPTLGDSSCGPFQLSLNTTTATAESKLDRSRFGESMRTNLWEDQVIVAARIPKDKVVALMLLSRGGYGEVYRGIYNRDPVAIKMLLPETRKDMDQINAFLVEVKIMATLEHERIVTFIGVAWDSLNDLCVVSEFMEGGDLRNLLQHYQATDCPLGFDADKVKIALHIAHALTYMHSLRPVVLHRDLKSKNILLDNQLNAKLTDFGVSRERIDQTMTAGVGTSLWMAPEVMMGERYNEKADIFSFGVVLSELSTHDIPYGKAKESGSGRKIPDSAVLQMVSQGRLQVKFTSESDPEVADLGRSCVSLDPKERPTASDVLYTLHNVLKGMHVAV